MPLFFQVLASGSKGNAILVCSPKTRILIDAGISGKELVRRLERTPVAPRQLDALVLSHEHQDHVRGAGVISRRFDLPVYLSAGTLEGLPPPVGQLASIQIFQTSTSFTVGDLRVHAFSTPHDAREPTGFVIEHDGSRLGICTDLGTATQLVKFRLQGCQGLVIEANHDMEMLLNGPYPPHLKQRIRSRHGHLSNTDTCELLQTLYHDCLQSVVFAHLSEVNNHPSAVLRSFEELCQRSQWNNFHIEIGKQHEITPGQELT